MRKSFLTVDKTLLDGGLKEVEEERRTNPPKKSAVMNVLTSFVGHKKAMAQGGAAAEALKNEENKEEDISEETLNSIGCTANVVLLDYEKNKIFVANAGDSRAVMGSAGKAIPLSFDHKPDDEVEIKRIEAAGSQIVDGRVDGGLNLTRALGDFKYK